MINRLSASGFRSLDNFSLEVKPGLNVLVGPNGGGKTNILALFSFVSTLANDEIGDAISSAGGASKVFKKTGSSSFGKEINIAVKGEMRIDRTLYLPSSYEKRLLDAGVVGIIYEWEARINSELGYDEAFYSKQTLRLRVVTKTLFVTDDSGWHLVLSVNSSGPQILSVEEQILDAEAVGLIVQNKRETLKDGFTIEFDDESGSTSPLFMNVENCFLIRIIGRDMRGGSTFNFDPAVCKKPNDSAQPPSLENNGDGLAATVYAIQKSINGRKGRLYYTFRKSFDDRTARTLQQYFCLINPAIHGVSAENNPVDNRIVVKIMVAGEKADVDFPLELASDGTVKWLAFTVALLTEENGFAIEEPENFLHPQIQSHAVDLVRTETEGSENLFVMMTTHSESLLNASRPEEIIIVSMEDGVTSAKRLETPDLVSEEIYKTGFGLGYFYTSGALSD